MCLEVHNKISCRNNVKYKAQFSGKMGGSQCLYEHRLTADSPSVGYDRSVVVDGVFCNARDQMLTSTQSDKHCDMLKDSRLRFRVSLYLLELPVS